MRGDIKMYGIGKNIKNLMKRITFINKNIKLMGGGIYWKKN